jgi:hypothetical protein
MLLCLSSSYCKTPYRYEQYSYTLKVMHVSRTIRAEPPLLHSDASKNASISDCLNLEESPVDGVIGNKQLGSKGAADPNSTKEFYRASGRDSIPCRPAVGGLIRFFTLEGVIGM